MGAPTLHDHIPGNKELEFTGRVCLEFYLWHCQEDTVLEVRESRQHISVPDRRSAAGTNPTIYHV